MMPGMEHQAVLRPAAQVSSWNLPEFDHLSLVSARYVNYTFPSHIHSAYAFVSIVRGVHQVRMAKASADLDNATLLTLNPGEVHSGKSGTEYGWEHRALFVEAPLMQSLAREIFGKDREVTFPHIAAKDAALSFNVRQLVESLRTDQDILSRETRVIHTLSEIISRFGEAAKPRFFSGYHPGVQRAIEFLLESFADKISLSQLAEIAGMSRYHFVRTFSAMVGMPPHAYQNQLRIQHAARLAAKGMSMADIALACGFADQAHFNRAFKATHGVSPSRYFSR